MFNDFMHHVICGEHANTIEVGDVIYEANYVSFDGKIYHCSNESYKLFHDLSEYHDAVAPRVLVYTPKKKQ